MKTNRSHEETQNPLATLPGIVAEYSVLKQQLVETMGELTPELECQLAVVETSLRSKVDSYHYVDESLEADAEFFKRKAAAFSALAKRFTTARERLKDNLKFAMRSLELKEIKGHDYRYCLERSAPKLVIDDAKLLPAEVVVQTITEEPNKALITSLIKTGAVVPGARLEEVQRLVPRENTRDE